MQLIEKANCNRNQWNQFTYDEQMTLLNNITHVMDCECFVVDGPIFYREICICDLENVCVKTYHLYDSSFPNFYDLTEKQQEYFISIIDSRYIL